MLANTQHRYGLISIVLHWLSAIAVFGLFALGYWMVDLTYYSEWYRTAPHIHKSIGLILLGLTIFRLVWKLLTVKPKMLEHHQDWEKHIAKMTHNLLYLLLITIMCSGYLISTADGRGIEVFDWFTVPSAGELFNNQAELAGLFHEFAAYGLMGIVALHALGALKHHFIDKDTTLKRMLWTSKRN